MVVSPTSYIRLCYLCEVGYLFISLKSQGHQSLARTITANEEGFYFINKIMFFLEYFKKLNRKQKKKKMKIGQTSQNYSCLVCALGTNLSNRKYALP